MFHLLRKKPLSERVSFRNAHMLLLCFSLIALFGCKTDCADRKLPPWLIESSQCDWQGADFVYAKVERCANVTASPEGISLPASFYYITLVAFKVNEGGKAIPMEFPLALYENKENFFEIYTRVDKLRGYSDIGQAGGRSSGYGENASWLTHPNLHMIAEATEASDTQTIRVSLAVTGRIGNFIHTEEVAAGKAFPVWKNPNSPAGSTARSSSVTPFRVWNNGTDLSLETVEKCMQEGIPKPCGDCLRFAANEIDFMEWSGKDHSSCLRSRLIGISVPRKTE